MTEKEVLDTTDVLASVDIFLAKIPIYNILWNYYSGNHELKYSTEKLKDVFDKLNVKFIQNWCGVVVDSLLDKLNMVGVISESDPDTKRIEEYYDSKLVDLEETEVHKDCLIFGESYIVVDFEDDSTDIFHNDPRICHMFYDEGNPKKKVFASKVWTEGKHLMMNLYYSDKIEYWKSEKEKLAESKKAGDWTQLSVSEIEAMPVFHYRSDLKQTSDITISVQTIQDAINKLFSDMMVSAEFGAFRQRYIISNADTNNLKNAPNEIWEIPTSGPDEGQTQVGEFGQTSLENYSKEISKLAQTIAIITRTPKHYFMETGGNISGEALLAMESPLNKKADTRRKSFESSWVELFEYLSAREKWSPEGLAVVWAQVASVQPLTEMKIIDTGVKAGIPLVTMLREIGWSEKKIIAMAKDKEEQVAMMTSITKQILEEKRNTGNDDD